MALPVPPVLFLGSHDDIADQVPDSRCKALSGIARRKFNEFPELFRVDFRSVIDAKLGRKCGYAERFDFSRIEIDAPLAVIVDKIERNAVKSAAADVKIYIDSG